MSRMSVICTAVALAAGAAVASAASIQTLSNPVADGAIITTAGNNVRSDWAGVTGYTADTNEGLTSDWGQVFIAHDSTNFYVRYVMNAVTNEYGWIDGNQRLFIDVDQNAATGFPGSMGIGADFMLEGSSLYAHSGSGWSWTGMGGQVYDDFPGGDHELTIARSSLGSPESFDFVAFGSGSAEDYYPNAGNLGASGDFFTYAVPEPASIGLGAVAAFGLLMRRARYRA